jgi:hypothetical protein
LKAVGTLAAQRQLPMPRAIIAATIIILVALTLSIRSICRSQGADGAGRNFTLLWANAALTVAATAWFSFGQPNLGARVVAALPALSCGAGGRTAVRWRTSRADRPVGPDHARDALSHRQRDVHVVGGAHPAGFAAPPRKPWATCWPWRCR